MFTNSDPKCFRQSQGCQDLENYLKIAFQMEIFNFKTSSAVIHLGIDYRKSKQQTIFFVNFELVRLESCKSVIFQNEQNCEFLESKRN